MMATRKTIGGSPGLASTGDRGLAVKCGAVSPKPSPVHSFAVWQAGTQHPATFNQEPSTKHQAPRTAFTLIELLVVTAILAVVIGVIGGALAGGLRVWQTSRDYNSFEMGTRVELAILERDVMNTFSFYACPLKGTRSQISMPGSLQDTGAEAVPGVNRPGTIKYLLGRDGTTLLRKAWAFPEDEPPDSEAEAMIKNVQRMDIEYLSGRQGASGQGRPPAGTWMSEWNNPTNLPGALHFRMLFPAEDNETRILERIFVLPCAQGGQGEKK